ncbi:hypothetical protein BIW11_12619 [Tropilaelaps mercedesae]|uniref:Nbr1 FW domain-containing protein n=1 Tax=Tropilaelaps mercedesae TaxID=418985 RepID=A0A1V9X5M1_9ACAR|nr:hypothetical protein BIW11_12619 [Tropilaelaps mercedesae]
MERVEVRLNLEDDDRVANYWRPLLALVSKVRYELACQFIKHENLPNGSVATPHLETVKAWRVRNTASDKSYPIMQQVEVRLNLKVPQNYQFYEIRQLIEYHFGTVRWLDSCEDDDRVANDLRPLLALVSKVRYELACQFIKHENLPNGSVVTPYLETVKTWRVRNTGTRDWPPGTCLRQCELLKMVADSLVPPLKVNEEGVISAQIRIPILYGYNQASIRLYHPNHGFFGEKLWVNFIIPEKGFDQESTEGVSTVGSYQNRVFYS